MAVDLINAVSNIPASPTAGDVIRFGTAITSGIPSNVKKANGTTTETAISVGDEYRYISTNWMKIGGDPIPTTPLKDITTLAESEFSTMIMGAVHNELNSGRLRKFGSSILHQALQEANPLKITYEETDIFSRDFGSQLSIARSDITIDLDIKTGQTRHSFDDGYWGYIFSFTEDNNDMDQDHSHLFATQGMINNLPGTQGNDNWLIGRALNTDTGIVLFRKITSTSIRIRFIGNIVDFAYLYNISGLKFNIKLETPV